MADRGEEAGEGRYLGFPCLGGPKATVLLVDGEELAWRRVAGGLWEFEVGFGRRALGYAGLWGLEEEEEEGEGGYGD